MRLTKHRKSILTLLKNNKSPMNAEEIDLSFKKGEIDLSTIYRSLDKLHTAGMISKSVIDNTAYYFISDKEHHHYMVCLTCKQMFELHCHIDNVTTNLESDTGFKIVQHDLTFYGYCQNCQTI